MKRLFVLFMALFAVAAVNAQSTFTYSHYVNATDDHDEINEEFTDNLNVALDMSGIDMTFIHITNVTDNDVSVKLNIERNSLAEGASAMICVDGNCMDAATSNAFDIAAGETFEAFDILYTYASGETSVVRINILDAETDAVLGTFTVTYAQDAAIPVVRNNEVKLSLSALPNPAVTYSRVTYSVPAKYTSAQLVVRNTLGSVIKKYNVEPGTNGKININVSDMNNGVYFYSLVSDGTTLSTKKFVVKH